MKLIFLGTGSAFTVGDNYHSNMLLEDNEHRLLIDCGSDARHSLNALGLTYLDIEAVYISHLHADHAGGLEWLGFTHKFDPRCQKPKLYITETLVDALWQHTLAGGMCSIQEYHCNLSTYFDVQAISSNNPKFHWRGVEFELISTIHIYDYDQLVPCFGLMLTVNGKSIYITADTQFTPDRLMPHYQRAELIFHDCETSPCKSGVHSHFTDLVSLPTALRQKMWLYHYNVGQLPDAAPHEFRGFVKRGQAFDLLDPNIYTPGAK